MTYKTLAASDDARWTRPVWIRAGYGPFEAIRSPRQALEQLVYRWPEERGPDYLLAQKLCHGALRTHALCERAREAFMQACVEASLIDGEDPACGSSLQPRVDDHKEKWHDFNIPQV
jgi:hypothetical protein